MKKTLLLSLSIFIVLCTKAQNPGIPGYHLIWADEFNGTALNTSNWRSWTGGPNPNSEKEYWLPENVSVAEGNLVLTARKQTVNGLPYTSGKVSTDHLFTLQYGHIEARLKVPMSLGMWPAFWMLGTNIDTIFWPRCGEIDIMEQADGSNTIFGTMHWEGPNGYTFFGNTTTSTPGDYHVYSVDWDTKSIRWYVDNNLYHTANIANSINGTGAFHKPFFLILNLAVGGHFTGQVVDDAALPASMYVDYVRVYSANPPDSVVSGHTYQVISGVNDRSVLDAESFGTANGTKVQLWDNLQSDNQRWKVTDVGGGYYKLQPANAPTKVMDVAGGGTDNGTQIQLWDDIGSNGQKWRLTPDGTGYYTLAPANILSRSLDVNAAASANGTKIQIWDNNGTNAQKWKFILADSINAPVANFTANTTPVVAGQSKTFTNSSTGASSYLWTFQGGTPATSTAANPVITYSSAGVYPVKLVVTNAKGSDSLIRTNYITVYPFADNIVSGRIYQVITGLNNTSLMEVRNSDTANGTRIQLWANLKNSNQKWKITDIGGGYYKLQPVNALTKVLDVAGGATGNGTAIQLWDDVGTSSQKWQIIPDGTGYSLLVPANAPGSRADISNVSSANGAIIHLWQNTGGANQKWKFILADDSTTKPVVKFTGSPTTVPAGQSVQFKSGSTGTDAYAWTFEGGTPATSTIANPVVTYSSGGFYTVKLVVSNAAGSDSLVRTNYITVFSNSITSGEIYQLISRVNNTSVLDVSGAGTANGTKVQLWENLQSDNQRWKVVDVGGGYYKLLPANAPTKALDVAGGGTGNGTQVQILDDLGTDGQKWQITRNSEGYYTLAPANAPGQRLDVNAASSANGTKIQGK